MNSAAQIQKSKTRFGEVIPLRGEEQNIDIMPNLSRSVVFGMKMLDKALVKISDMFQALFILFDS